jgi:hypothetical protein
MSMGEREENENSERKGKVEMQNTKGIRESLIEIEKSTRG